MKKLINNRLPQQAAEMERSETKNLNVKENLHWMIKSAIDQTSDAIGIATAEGEHFYQNETFSRMFGYELSDFKTMHPSRIYRDPDVAKEVFETIMSGDDWSGETEIITNDGREVPVELRASAIKNEAGIVIGLIGIHSDITDYKKAQNELLETNTQLEEAIERANQMAVEAEMANIAKSTFLANMSHEIRTPMNGVIGMAGLLLDSNLDDEQREYVKAIQDSGDSLLSIINDILDYSKIEAGKFELETIDFDLRVTLDAITDLVAIKAFEKGLEYLTVVSHDIPSLLCGDPGRLRQILINLIGNATKFTETGEVVLRVELEEETLSHSTVRFRVIDTGIGIPEDKIDRLFHSFSQVDASTTRKFGGTGLGLRISKQLAEMMGGEAGVKSEEGKGSEFWFTAVFEKQPDGREKKIVIPKDIKEKRILIAGENPTGRYVLREQLKLWGCRYKDVASGNQALRELRRAVVDDDRFEIAILDTKMNDMYGEMLGEKIKQDPDLNNTALVMMTSMGKRGDAKHLEDIGFAAYLTKPIKQGRLYNCLSTIAGVQQAPAEKTPTASLITRHTIREDEKQRIRILLAEDNLINQKVAKKTLGKLGYNTDIVANGKKAIEALENTAYDIVLMDCQMPEMDGYDATGEIRDPNSNVLNHKVPVIAMTAHAMEGDREKCLQAGMDDYLTKPVKPKDLAGMLEKWLS